MSGPPILFGHRGASAEAPENTMLAFARAIERGATGLEMDIHLTRDGAIVVAHDDTAERTAGVTRPIRECLLADVQSWDVGARFVDEAGDHPFRGGDSRIPLLSEVITTFEDVMINIDLKQPGMAPAVVALLRELGAEARVVLTSFDRATVGDVRRRGYTGPTGLCRDEVLGLLCVPTAVRRFWPVAGDAVQIPRAIGPLRLDGRRLIAKCHRLDLRVDYWTINDASVAEQLLSRGADGIMTDDPATIAPVFRARGII